MIAKALISLAVLRLMRLHRNLFNASLSNVYA